MKIFITGWSGFVGSHLTPILETHYQVHKMRSDLLDFSSVEQEMLSFAPDVVIHLAARTEVEKSFYEQVTFSQTNYVGTVNLIETACKLKKKPCFFFASTMEVYGWQPISDEIQSGNIPVSIPVFDENTPANPNAPYAVAKLGCEKYLEYAHRSLGLDYVIVRQTNSYGRKDNDFFVTEQIITQMLTNPDECNLGYGNPFRNFIFVDDLIDAWNTMIIQKDVIKNNIFTIGPDEPVQIKQHAQNIANLIGWKGQINWNTKPKRPGEIYLLNSNSKKLSQLTGWYPNTGYIQGLMKTIGYWKEKLKHEKHLPISTTV